MPEQTNDKITFYNSSNIPLPALTEKADTQELQEELLIRRLNHAFNWGMEHERKAIQVSHFQLRLRIENYRQSLNELMELKNDMFPATCVIHVQSTRYAGYGIVWKHNQLENPSTLVVLLENGGSWDYPLDDCRRVDDQKQWPKWVKDSMSERKDK